MFMGIDCGTQGTKALLFDPAAGKVLAIGHAPHDIIANDNGRREQHPSWWIEAMVAAVRAAMEKSGCRPEDVKAIGCSGQQHGLVMLDKDGAVLREAKLWNDMETAPENDEIHREVGGVEAMAKRLGTSVPVGYTASKIRWMLKHDPDLYRKTRHVLLPHDYLNYWLTGRAVMEPGEASGTGYFQVVEKRWDRDMANLIDPTGVLDAALPDLIGSSDCVGPLRPEAAARLGLTTDTLVCGGSGDNVMGAFGTGGVEAGAATLGIGTSGVLNIFSEHPIADFDPVMQVFAGAAGGWLVTTCTVNATSATTSVQKMFGLSLDAFSQAIGAAAPGAGGLLLHPFFSGERMPPLPNATGTLSGMTTGNLTRDNLIRAAAEAVVLGLKWGYERQMRTLPKPNLLRLTGGGTANPDWRQIVADVFDCEAVCLVHDEGGAFGGALIAMLMYENRHGRPTTAAELSRRYILFDDRKRARPIPERVTLYADLYEKYDSLRKKLYGQ